MFGINRKGMSENMTEKEPVSLSDEDEFQIPELILCKTPDEDEMKKRKRISSLRKQYGIRIEETAY